MGSQLARVVNLRRGEGCDLYCGRAGRGQDGTLGNPFERDFRFNGLNAVVLHRFYFHGRIAHDTDFRDFLEPWVGRPVRLGCFCVDEKGHGLCHANTIAEYLNARNDELAKAQACTGVSAFWCPAHGDCTCPRNELGERWDPETEIHGANWRDCPLHQPGSAHGEKSNG